MLAVALTSPAVRMLPCVALPVVEINPGLNKLPPATLPVTLRLPNTLPIKLVVLFTNSVELATMLLALKSA